MFKCLFHERWLFKMYSFFFSGDVTTFPFFPDLKMRDTFSFSDYDAIGFDLDHCICRYNLPELFQLVYDLLTDYLVKQSSLPTELLKTPFDADFVMKGLFLDLHRGNVLKIDSNGKILAASHGTKRMRKEEIAKTYNDFRWKLTDRYIEDPLSLWLCEDSMKIQAQTDYFDLPVALIFARLIDSIDGCSANREQTYQVFPDILNGLHNMYDIENFQANRGGYYTAVQQDPTRYVFPSGDAVFNWIQSLKDAGKFVYLLSGSHIDYGSFVAEKALGSKWSSLFDLKIFRARKPGFWTLNRPFVHNQIDVPPAQLAIGESYLEGNYNHLTTFLKKHLKNPCPKMLYIGDSLIQDVYAPNNFCGIDTVAIVEELEAENVYGHATNQRLATALGSSYWGGFFAEKCHPEADTFWNELIKKHARYVTPSVSVLAEKPVQHRYPLQY